MDMDNLNIKAITEEIANTIIDLPLERRSLTHIYKNNLTPDEVRRSLINGVWQICLDKLQKEHKEYEPLAAEKAIAILIRLGAVNEKVVFKTDSFRVRLANSEYRIYKLGSSLDNPGSIIKACPWPADGRYDVRLSGERFAAFLQAFDAEIPFMEGKVPQIMEKRREKELEEIKRQMERMLKDRIIKTLLDQYLTPLGITAHYTIRDDNVVAIELQKTIISRHEIPFEKLCENMQELAKFGTIFAS